MQQKKHDWLFDVFSGIQSYMEDNDLEHSTAELQILQLTLEQELGNNVLEFRQMSVAGSRREK